jgi:ABC-type lipoprotein release transport system permease subunit
MFQLFQMAFRDLGRNRRRSFLSALALGIGLALLMMMDSVIVGEFNSSVDAAIKLQSGDLQVRAESYNENTTSLAWEDLVADPTAIADQISAMPQVKAATPRLYASGIISDSEQSVGVRVIGIDPDSSANAPFKEGMVSGQFISADDREGVLIGETLADKLGLGTGDTINLLVNTSNGDVVGQPFVIRGIYTTKIPGYDQTTLFMPLSKAQAISGAQDHASLIFINLKDRSQSQAVANAIQGTAYQVKTWQQLNELLIQTETLANTYIYVLYLIVLAITATVIVNTLVMAVFERTREIGILSAVGMRSGRIMTMFFIESFLLAIGGIAVGIILGALLVAYTVNIGLYIGNFGLTGILLGERIYGGFSLQNLIYLAILALVVTLVASIYPALLAARMEPVKALHGGQQA